MGFVKHTVLLVAGNMTAQIITLAFVPIITRIFSPEEFGYFALLMSIAGPLSAIASFRYNEVSILPKDNDDGLAIVLLSIAILALLSTSVFIIALLVKTYLPATNIEYFGNSNVIFAIPIVVFLLSFKRVLDVWQQRCSAFALIAKVAIYIAVVDRLIALIGGYFSSGDMIWLVCSKIAGIAIGIAFLLKGTLGSLLGLFRTSDNLYQKVKKNALAYIDYPKYAWSSLLTQLNVELPVILLGVFYSPIIVGYFALSKRVLMEPGLLVGDALSKTFYHKVTSEYNSGQDIRPFLLKIFSNIIRIISVPMVLFAISAPEIFELIFGGQWLQSGYYVQYLTPLFIVTFMMRPISRLFNLFNLQKELALFAILNLSLSILVLVLGGILSTTDYTLIAFSTTSALIGGTRIVRLYKHAGITLGEISGLFTKGVTVCIFLGVPIITLKGYIPDIWYIIISILEIAMYYGYLFATDTEFKNRFTRTSK